MLSRSKSIALAAGAILSLATSASAQNTAVSATDLLVTFQNPGGTQGATAIVTAVAGTTTTTARAANFRDAVPGSFTNLTNIGTGLTNAFGGSWFDQTTLYMAGFDNIGTSDTATAVTFLDPQRTLYYSRVRTDVGTVGLPNSTPFDNSNTSFFSAAAVGMNGPKTQFEQLPGTTANNTPLYQTTTAVSSLDEALPFGQPGVQQPAFGVIAGGIQGNFGAGSFGVFGAAGTVELALDLYRIQPATFGDGTPITTGFPPGGVSQFLGTLTLDSTGQLAFTAAIPEPSVGLLLGTAAVTFFGAVRRRKSVA